MYAVYVILSSKIRPAKKMMRMMLGIADTIPTLSMSCVETPLCP
jgi:hypothetical protein